MSKCDSSTATSAKVNEFWDKIRVNSVPQGLQDFDPKELDLHDEIPENKTITGSDGKIKINPCLKSSRDFIMNRVITSDQYRNLDTLKSLTLGVDRAHNPYGFSQKQINDGFSLALNFQSAERADIVGYFLDQFGSILSVEPGTEIGAARFIDQLHHSAPAKVTCSGMENFFFNNTAFKSAVEATKESNPEAHNTFVTIIHNYVNLYNHKDSTVKGCAFNLDNLAQPNVTSRITKATKDHLTIAIKADENFDDTEAAKIWLGSYHQSAVMTSSSTTMQYQIKTLLSSYKSIINEDSLKDHKVIDLLNLNSIEASLNNLQGTSEEKTVHTIKLAQELHTSLAPYKAQLRLSNDPKGYSAGDEVYLFAQALAFHRGITQFTETNFSKIFTINFKTKHNSIKVATLQASLESINRGDCLFKKSNGNKPIDLTDFKYDQTSDEINSDLSISRQFKNFVLYEAIDFVLHSKACAGLVAELEN